MSLSKNPISYPSSMHVALDIALANGEFVIPCESPIKMRLQFQGLRGALRAAGKGEKADLVGFYLQDNPPALIIRLKDFSSIAQEVTAAVETLPQPSSKQIPKQTDAEAAMARILGFQ